MTPARILLVEDQRQGSRVLRSESSLTARGYLTSDITVADEALAATDRALILGVEGPSLKTRRSISE